MKEQDIERDHNDLVGQSLVNRSHATDGLLELTPQNELLLSELPLFLRKIRFNE